MNTIREELSLVCEACGRVYRFSQSGSAEHCFECEEIYRELKREGQSSKNHRKKGHRIRGVHKRCFL